MHKTRDRSFKLCRCNKNRYESAIIFESSKSGDVFIYYYSRIIWSMIADYYLRKTR